MISKRYFIAYDFKKKVIWYRLIKVGTRSILKLSGKENGSDFLYPSARACSSGLYKKMLQIILCEFFFNDIEKELENKFSKYDYLFFGHKGKN